VGAGPSGKTWPRWESHAAHITKRCLPRALAEKSSTFLKEDNMKKPANTEAEVQSNPASMIAAATLHGSAEAIEQQESAG